MRARADEMLRAALRYADSGWPVFRCKPGAKVPLDGSGGFKDATTDAATIRAWWRAVPYNVAIPTGTATADVLDVDVKPEGSGWAALNRLKRAGLLEGARAMVRTRSGGLHIYFAGTGQACGRLPQHHLDFKAAGGYVLLPPSFVEADDKGPAGSYELLDHRTGDGRLDWAQVRQLLDPPKPAPAAEKLTAAKRGGTCRPGDCAAAREGRCREVVDCARAREGICRKVAESNDGGGWAGVLFWAGCRYRERGTSVEEALADLLPAAAPWNGHEERRAAMHITNGWHAGAGEAVAR